MVSTPEKVVNLVIKNILLQITSDQQYTYTIQESDEDFDAGVEWLWIAVIRAKTLGI